MCIRDSVYCRTAINDIRVRRRLEAKYPGRILTLNYEDVVGDLRLHADLVYRFLGFASVPYETTFWIKQNEATVAKEKANATKSGYLSPLEKWTKRLNPDDSTAIFKDICEEYFRLTRKQQTDHDTPPGSS